jgi:hypothetical protein
MASIFRGLYFLYYGNTHFTRQAFETKQKIFSPSALDVDLTGKVMVVTGANSGIGKETALAFARRGQ